MDETKKINTLFSIVIILVLLSVLVIFRLGTNDSLGLDNFYSENIYKSNNISFYSLDLEFKKSNLQINDSDINNFSFSFVPRALSDGTLPSLGIATSYMTYKIRTDDKLLYSYGDEDRKIAKSNGTDFNIIRIPSENIGERVYVDFNLEVVKLNKNKFNVYLGSKKNIVKKVFLDEYIALFVAFFMFLISSMMIVMGILSLLFKMTANRYIAVGLFIMFLSSYIFVQTESIYLFFGNPIFVYFLTYILASLYVASLAYILYSSVRGKNRRLARLIYEIFLINISVQSVIAILGISEFIYFREFTFAIVFILSSVMIYILFVKRDPEYPFKKESFKEKLIAYASMIMLAGLLIGSIMYNISISSPFLLPVYVSLTIYIMIHFFVSLDTYTKDYKKAKRLRHFVQAALYDNLTKVGSRYAFDSDIKEFKENISNYQDIILGILDINNLKLINDGNGHDFGDKVIADLGLVLKHFEEEYLEQNAKAYRIGGDEFVFLMFNTGEEVFYGVEDTLNRCYEDYLSSNPDTMLKFSLGFDYARISEDFNFGEFLKEIDDRMYFNKRQMKENDIA